MLNCTTPRRRTITAVLCVVALLSATLAGCSTGPSTLVTFDKATRSVTFDGAAQSVTSTDNTHWTIKLKSGWTFHDGTAVTAQSYVRAWNYTALSTNAQSASYFFSNIQGYDDLQGVDDRAPTATTMSGLSAPDPTTIKVTLSEPFAIYPLTLGYSGFNPLPEAFYANPVAFGKKPVGNGPFRADTEWVPGRGITLSRCDNYAGKDKAKSRGVVMRMYTEISTAYTDVLAGDLDILNGLPPDALRGTGFDDLAVLHHHDENFSVIRRIPIPARCSAPSRTWGPAGCR